MNLIARFLTRHDGERAAHLHLKAVAGAMAAVLLIGGLAALINVPLLLAPLAPTSMIIFAQPENPAAQPLNILAAYFIAAVLGTLAELIFPGTWWVAVLAVGGTMALMLVGRVTHPPASSVPLALLASPMQPLPLFSLMFASCLVLIGVGMLVHRLPPRVTYPRRNPPDLSGSEDDA